MKIDYALMSCDLNPLYHDFIPVVTKAWNRIGIKPVFAIISESPNKKVVTNESIIYYFKRIPSLKIDHQSTFARIWLWKKLKGNSILSDVDMIPLSGKYFNGIAEQYNENQIVSYCYDAIDKFLTVPACYILASSNIMDSLIEEKTWNKFIKNRAIETGEGWGGDQWYIGKLLDKHNDVVKLKRGWYDNGEAHNRLDRNTWVYNDTDVKNEKIYDCHSLRPYDKYKDEIDKLINLLS